MKIREMARRHKLRAVQARLLLAAHPEDCARVSQLLGGDLLMAAYTLLDSGCDVEKCCAHLEKLMMKLASDMFKDAKARVPVDTGVLRQSTRSSR